MDRGDLETALRWWSSFSIGESGGCPCSGGVAEGKEVGEEAVARIASGSRTASAGFSVALGIETAMVRPVRSCAEIKGANDFGQVGSN